MRSVLAALILCAWLAACMVVEGKAAEPWKPFRIVLLVSPTQSMVSGEGFSTRDACEAVLASELLRFATTDTVIRWGRCRADGDEI